MLNEGERNVLAALIIIWLVILKMFRLLVYFTQFAGGIIGKGGQNIKRLRQEVRKSVSKYFILFQVLNKQIKMSRK